MSKKKFTGTELERGFNSLLGEKRTPGRPKTTQRIITKSSQEGTPEGESRATFIVKEELIDKLKAMAYWERSLIKEVVNNILGEAVASYEKKKGKIKPIPKK